MSDDYLNNPLNMGVDGPSKSSLTGFPSSNRHQQQSPISSFSPYLNYDPRILQTSQPEFIFPEGASKQRGRFELAFSQIGSAVMVYVLNRFFDLCVLYCIYI